MLDLQFLYPRVSIPCGATAPEWGPMTSDAGIVGCPVNSIGTAAVVRLLHRPACNYFHAPVFVVLDHLLFGFHGIQRRDVLGELREDWGQRLENG